MISDLGSLNYTPMPKFLDDAAMFSAVIMVPAIFYLKKHMCTAAQLKAEEKSSDTKGKVSKVIKFVLSNFGLLFGLGAMVGFFGIGFFSEDLGNAVDSIGLDLSGIGSHFFFSIWVFACLCICGLFIGIFVVMYPKTIKEKYQLEKVHWAVFSTLGLLMIIWPPTHAFLFLAGAPPSRAFHEWFMLFAILAWVLPVFYILRKHTKKKAITR